jgi:hypothetical protein
LISYFGSIISDEDAPSESDCHSILEAGVTDIAGYVKGVQVSVIFLKSPQATAVKSFLEFVHIFLLWSHYSYLRVVQHNGCFSSPWGICDLGSSEDHDGGEDYWLYWLL